MAQKTDDVWNEHKSADSWTETAAEDATLDCIDPRLERDADVILTVVEATKVSVTECL